MARRGDAPMIWRSALLGALCGFSTSLVIYDGPTLYYQGLGFGVDWSYETALSVSNRAAIVTVLLIFLGCARAGRPRRDFVVASALANTVTVAFGESVGKDVEDFPPRIDALVAGFIGYVPISLVIFGLVFLLANGLTLLGRAIWKPSPPMEAEVDERL